MAVKQRSTEETEPQELIGVSLTLSVVQRVNLDNVFTGLRGKPDDKAELYYDIILKIELSPEERKMYTRAIQGTIAIDEEASEGADKQILFERQEARQILKAINGSLFDGFSPRDLKWIKPLKKQLETAHIT